MITRTKYIEKIRPFYKSDLIKVITGIRRCGKSVLLRQISDEIALTSRNVVFLELESRRTREAIPNADALLKHIDERKKRGKCYVFLDEAQYIEGWQDVCKTLRLENCSVFVTGSNSKMLSSEFASELSGRYVSFRLRPFVFKEAQQYARSLRKRLSVTDYLVWGGFPQRFEFAGKAMLDYLFDLDETIIHNDIALRYSIKKDALFRRVCNFVFRSNSRIVSAKSIADFISVGGEKCSAHTVANYIDYIAEAFGIDKIKPFSTRTKQELAYYYKIYNADVSLNSLRCHDGRFDLDHNLENAVYNELLYRDYDLTVFRDGESEIDFVAEKSGKKFCIQVAHSVQDEKAYEREFAALASCKIDAQKILITLDDIDYSTSQVRHLKLKDFLLMDDL